MTDSAQQTDSEQPDTTALSLVAGWFRARPTIVWIALAGAAFIVTTISFWISDALILDDYVACAKTEELGILGMARWYLFDFVGLYRPLTIPMLMGTSALCGAPAFARAFGLVLHLTGAGLAFHVARTGFRWHRIPSAFASLAILFTPVAMEATGWIAAARAYPFGLVLVLWMTLRLTTGKHGWATALIGASAVIVQEQTLFAVVFLIFVLTPGSFWRRVRDTMRAVIPIGVYFVVLIASSMFLADASRFGSENGASIANLFENLDVWAVNLRSYLPLGSIWMALARGPYTAAVWVAIGLVGTGIAVAARHDYDGFGKSGSIHQETIHPAVRAICVAGIALMTSVLFVLPLMLAAVPWVSPRVVYLPLAALGFVFAAALEVLLVVIGRVSVIPVTAAIVALALLVIPGVARDASAMTDLGRQERSIAAEIATQADVRGATVVVLISPPWSIAESGTSVGEHLVQAFAVGWAAGPAIVAVTNFDPAAVIVDREAAVCVDSERVVNTKTGDAWPTRQVLVYDFASRSVVPEAETDDAIPACPAS